MKGKMGLWLAVAFAIAALMLSMYSGSGTDTATREEKRMAEVLSAIAGAGRVEVVLFYEPAAGAFETAGAPTGALVVAQGADDLSVRLNLIRAVRTLLGLPESAVDVFAMEEKK